MSIAGLFEDETTETPPPNTWASLAITGALAALFVLGWVL